MAAAALIGPFLRELTSATGAAIDTIAEDTGNALRGCAARAWRTLFGRDGAASGGTPAPAPDLGRSATEDPDPRLVETVQERMQMLDVDALAALEALLRDAERNGGPRLGTTRIEQSVRGHRNLTIGQNTGNITLGGM